MRANVMRFGRLRASSASERRLARLAVGSSGGALGPTELRVVRFAGAGAVVLETSSALVTLGVTPASGIVVRREVVVGWLGILDITPVLPADAPGAHHGLVRFQGEGSVLVSGL